MANIVPVSNMLNPIPDFNRTWREGVQFGQQQRQQSEARQREQQVRNLAPQIVAGDPAAIAQGNAADPRLTGEFQDAGDSTLRRFKGFVSYIDGAREQAKQTGDWRHVDAALQQANPWLTQILGKPGPTAWPQGDPQWEAGWESLKARIAGLKGGAEQQRNMVVSPGSAVVDPRTGQLIYERPFAPANGAIVKVPDGQGGTIDMVWDPRTRQLSDLPAPGQGNPPAQQASWVQPGASYQTPQGIVRIDPDIDPADLEAVQADIVGGGQSDNLTLPQRDVSPSQFRAGGGLGYTPPKRPERDTFVMMSADEVAAAGLPPGTVAQRNLTTGKIEIGPTSVQPGSGQSNKPMPVTALKLLQESREALSVSSGIDSELGAIYDDLQSGRLTLGPMANWIARGRNATGLSTDESRRFQGMMNTFEKMRNDSLRLNKGVQTEGDAQRAWNELFGNLSDSRNVMTQLERIRRLNERAILLHQENMEEVEANYGRREPVSAPQAGVGNDDRRRALLDKY